MKAKLDADAEERLYREYITESLRMSVDHKYITVSWADMVNDALNKKTFNKTGDQIAYEVIRAAGLKFGIGGEQ